MFLVMFLLLEVYSSKSISTFELNVHSATQFNTRKNSDRLRNIKITINFN